jgi:hypothetical protein
MNINTFIFMEMDMDMDMVMNMAMVMDMDMGMDKERDKKYGLGHEKVFIKKKKTGTHCGREEPECCLHQ